MNGDTGRAIGVLEGVDLDGEASPTLAVQLGRLYRSRGTIPMRLRSQQTLERALQVHPDNVDVLVALGRTYFEQTFYPDAKRCLYAALSQDSSICEAHYLLGVYHYETWKRVNQYRDDLSASRDHLASALDCSEDGRDALRRYAFASYVLADSATALDLAVQGHSQHPDEYLFCLLRGALRYDADDLTGARVWFDRGLERMDDETHKAYTGARRFLSAGEQDDYRKSNPVDRETARVSYWIDADTDPTTAENPAFLEHVYRTFLAEVHFSSVRPFKRGWQTERGQTLIKFGWPESIESTLGDSWKSGRVEFWNYLLDGSPLVFTFVDEFLNGNLRIPYSADVLVDIMRYNPRVSRFAPPQTSIPGKAGAYVFRDDEMGASVYLTFRVDADSLLAATDLRRANHFWARTSLFDSRWQRNYDVADTLWTSETRRVTVAGRRWYDVTQKVDVAFDNYHLACAWEDSDSSARAVGKASVDGRRFATGELCISDIVLRDATREGSLIRNGAHFPKLDARYLPGEKVSVYFEVYNLRMEGGQTDYDLTFAIYDDPETAPPRVLSWARTAASWVGIARRGVPSLEQTLRRAGETFTAIERLDINVEKLKRNRRYTLEIAVVDHVGGTRTTLETAFFLDDVD